ncbi:uncharacterized protein [Arachis hypogaea]|uniref:uncharacterized protein n=1 Tax=Arachis hypogaea TaxID=3818 RepID=UPI0034E6DD3A
MAQPASSSSAVSSTSSMAVDPYNLSPADQPGLILVTQQLVEDNYHSWSRAMQKALNSKRKLGFITGSVPKPDPITEPEKFENWQCVNDVISTWILNSVTKEIATSLVYTDSAAKLWNNFKERFQHGNGPRVFELKRDLMNLRHGAMSVSQYFTRIKVLWEELNSYRPVQCNCGDARAMQEFLQAGYIHCFLMGLDESFSQIRGKILLLEPLPTINKVLSLVTQEEKHRAIIGASLNFASQNQVAFLARNQQPPQSQGRGRGMVKKDRPLCSHCGILGHTIDKCYKIHGYPPNFGKGRNMKPSIHHVSTSQSTSDAQISPNLAPTQVQQLLTLLNDHKI